MQDEAKYKARLAYELALTEMRAAERALQEAQAAAQKALMEYNSHILGETK